MEPVKVSLESISKLEGLTEIFEPMIVPVRQSGILKSAGCARKFLYEERWRLRLKTTSPISARSRGQMVHKCLELGNFDEFDNWVMDQIATLKKAVPPSSDMFGDLQRTIDQYCQQAQMAKMIVTLFNEKHGNTPNLETLHKEQTYVIRVLLDGSDMYLSGTLDQIVRDTRLHAIGIRDYKTTGLSVDYAYAGYSFGIQNKFYRLLAYLALKETPRFFILNILAMPSIVMSGEDRNFTTTTKVLKSGPNKGELREEKNFIGAPTFSNYLDRCRLWYQNNAIQALTSYTIFYTEPLITTEFMPYIHNTWKNCKAVPCYDNFPRDLTNTQCKAYNKVCPFMDICQSSESMHLSLLKQKFEIHAPSDYTTVPLDNSACHLVNANRNDDDEDVKITRIDTTLTTTTKKG